MMLRALLFLTLMYFSLSGSLSLFIVGSILYSVRYVPYELLIIATCVDAFALGTDRLVFNIPFVLVASCVIFVRIIIQPYIRSDLARP